MSPRRSFSSLIMIEVAKHRRARNLPRASERGLKATWPAGCKPPSGYCAWHEWASAQMLHGLRQGRCKQCGRYRFPQELNQRGGCCDQKECRRFVVEFGKLKATARVRARGKHGRDNERGTAGDI